MLYTHSFHILHKIIMEEVIYVHMYVTSLKITDEFPFNGTLGVTLESCVN
jgi:hypothetical protein